MNYRLLFTGGIVLIILMLALVGAAVYWTISGACWWERQLTSTQPEVVEAVRKELLNGSAKSMGILRGLLARPRQADWQSNVLPLRVLEILAELGPAAQQAAPEVVALLEASDAHVRTLAIQTLPAIGTRGEVAVPALKQALERSPEVSTLRALAEYGPQAEAASPQLVAILARTELDPEVRWNAARTMGKTRTASESAIEALVAGLADSEPTVREHAAEALGDVGPAAAHTAPALVKLLQDEHVKVRRDAVRSLGQIQADPAVAVPAVQALLDDPELIVRMAAQQALDQLTKPSETPE